MPASDALIIARKDLHAVWRRRGMRWSILAFPLLSALALPMVVRWAADSSVGVTPDAMREMLRSFLFFFLIAATSLPTAIASYSLVGEKVERSLEPLLATPVSVVSVLVGKMLSAVLPTLFAVWLSAGVFMALANRAAEPVLGAAFFPQRETWVELLVLMPLVVLLTVNIDIVVSSRVSDVRSAQQIAGLVVLPVSGIFIAAELGSIALGERTLWVMSAVVAVLGLGMLALARRVFEREQILTRWS